MVESTNVSRLPPEVAVTPSLVCLAPGRSTCKVPVEITNNSGVPVTLPPKIVIGELHAVSEVVTNCGGQRAPEEPTQSGDCSIEFQHAALTETQRKKVQTLLKEMDYVFAKSNDDLGCTAEVQHEIKLTDDQSVKQPCCRVPPAQLDEFREAVKNMLEAGVIKESKSPYSSPIVLVRKKDKGLRICVDFRQLNRKTIKDAYRIPRIKETLKTLQGAKWFCTLDLQSGYLQVEMAEKDREKTGMTAPFGLYEFNRMLFGLTNAPATFQRLMERCLGDLNLRTCLVYLDDIVVFGKSFDETLERLEAVLKRLGKFGLKLKPSKCKIFLNEIPFLGHIVSDKGVAPDPSKVESVTDWLSNPPSSTSELQNLLGICGVLPLVHTEFLGHSPAPIPTFGWSYRKQETLPLWR